MYSIVLMAAMTSTPDTASFNGYFRDLFRGNCNGCNGCSGCSGGVRYSGTGCCGSSSYTASCSGCTGCCGGTIFGWGLGERVRRWFDTAGSGCCGGGCCGGRSYAGGCCGGSAYSCFGSPTYSYTPIFNGGLSCQGGLPYSAPPPMFDTYPAPGMPGVPYAVPVPAPGMVGLKSAGHTAAVPVSNSPTARATVFVRLPADAKLFADGRALAQTGADRKFVSPDLPADREFVYQFRAEYDRSGETVSVTKKVPVRAGATVNVEFVDLTAARPAGAVNGLTSGLSKSGEVTARPAAREPVKAEPPVAPNPTGPVAGTPDAPPSAPAAERATITVKLPPGAALYVDDRKSPSAEPVRSFSTPPLPAGREFAYLLKAEVVRNGQPESLTQKVPFRAGERVIVDFTSLGK
jgi:uncharacterized protein (TIGR03000 family)